MGWSPAFAFRDCAWCGASMVQMYQVVAPDSKSTAADGAERYWMMLICPRCAAATIVEYSRPGTDPSVVRVLPEGGHASINVADLPEDVEGYFRDALRVLQAGVPDAAAVQLRRTLEAAAAHFGVKPYPLVKAIRALIDQGLVTAVFGEVLGHIRDLGNIGAHASDARIGQEAAERALRFTTQVLRNLFEIPADLERLGKSAIDEEPTPDEKPPEPGDRPSAPD